MNKPIIYFLIFYIELISFILWTLYISFDLAVTWYPFTDSNSYYYLNIITSVNNMYFIFLVIFLTLSASYSTFKRTSHQTHINWFTIFVIFWGSGITINLSIITIFLFYLKLIS